MCMPMILSYEYTTDLTGPSLLVVEPPGPGRSAGPHRLGQAAHAHGQHSVSQDSEDQG